MEINDCFIIMPFSSTKTTSAEKWTEIYESFFKPAWKSFGIEAHRVANPRGSITKEIVNKLFISSVVLADLTGSNSNVMYELGVRHSFRKPSIMLKQKGTKIPFDVDDYTVHDYEYTPKGLEDLKKLFSGVIQDIKQYPNKSDNPVWDFLTTSDFIESYYETNKSILKLTSLADELDMNYQRCYDFLGKTEHIELPGEDSNILELDNDNDNDERQLTRDMVEFFPSIQSDSLTHLRITRYVEFSLSDWKTLLEIANFYTWCHFYSSNLGLSVLNDVERDRIVTITSIIRTGSELVRTRLTEIKKLFE